MSRYAIISPAGLFFSDNRIDRTEKVVSEHNDSFTRVKHWITPMFEEIRADRAIKYDTLADAQDAMNHVDLTDLAAFNGSKIVETDFDPANPKAFRQL